MQVTMTVNGTEVTRDVEPRLLLVHFLRETLGLTSLGLQGLAVEAGAVLVGQRPSEDLFAEAAELAREASAPVEDQRGPVDYKRHLAAELTQRALTRALDRAAHLTAAQGG